MTFRHMNRWLIGALAVLAILALGGLMWIHERAVKALESSAQELSQTQSLRYKVLELKDPISNEFDWFSAPAVFSGAAEFQGRLYLCGPEGLYAYEGGRLVKQFRTGRELPPSPLVRLAVAALADAGQPELVIATADEGLLAFDGTSFRQIRPDDSDARQTTSILPLASGRLLIGTSKKGVLIYDGRRLGPFHPALANMHVTELAGDESDLWVGTMDRGVLHWHGGIVDEFNEAQGLPDPQVLSLAADNDRAFVGTPLGIAEFQQGRFERVLARGAFAQTLCISGTSLFVGTFDQGVIQLPLASGAFPGVRAHATTDVDRVVQIFAFGGEVYALTREGLHALKGHGVGSESLVKSEDALLSDDNISALSVDASGRVWVGFFDRGMDILDPRGAKIRHVEDDHMFCVNRIVPLSDHRETAVATADGLVLFDEDGTERQVLMHSDGLVSDHVTDIALTSSGMALATPAGITFLDNDGTRSLYSFQGLVNNHVYSLGTAGTHLLAGTLGGISVLDREQVVSNYTVANSELRRNWISAIVPLGSEWMVGTYGGGVMRLDEEGHFHSYEIATGNVAISPNAMLVTDQHVFAGTLDQGLLVYDRSTSRWSRVARGLPSENVTALAAANGYIYIGTDHGLVRAREQDLQP